VFHWFGKRLARRAALIAGCGSAIGATLVVVFTGEVVGDVPLPLALGSILGSGGVAAVVAVVIVEKFVAQRLAEMARVADSTDGASDLARLPISGEDELADTANAFNRLLARLTSLRVSVMDTSRELAEAQGRLELQAALERKTKELEARLRDRAIVYDLLRLSVTTTELEKTLATIAVRIGTDLGMRETALVIKDGKRFSIRGTHGFSDPKALLDRIVDPSTGVTGHATRSLEPIVVDDVTTEPEYLSFWGFAERSGSFAAIPIVHQGTLLGVISVTRPVGSPFTENDVRLLRALADQTALAIKHAQLFEELRALSTTDELTGLPNRRLLARRLEHEIDRAQRFGKPVAVLAIDIDHFKLLNDTLGHQAGDVALVTVADAMQACVRRVDTVARTGGEEFIVLLAETDLDIARKVAEKLRARIAATDIRGDEVMPDGKLTVSVGIAQLRDSEDAIQLIARADEALYSAKRRGRNRVIAHEDGISLVPLPTSNPPNRM
jgi:diguanylate cyclase (GGDEF)-like protein